MNNIRGRGRQKQKKKKSTPQVGISDVREQDTGVGATAVGAGVVLWLSTGARKVLRAERRVRNFIVTGRGLDFKLNQSLLGAIKCCNWSSEFQH